MRNYPEEAYCNEPRRYLGPSHLVFKTFDRLIITFIYDLLAVDYSRESLIEMIALHVEASFPEAEIWKEFADCLIFFFDNLDEDRMSVCLDGSGEERNQQTYSVRYNPTPRMFTDASWTLRAKWWLSRHFSPEMLETESKKGIYGFIYTTEIKSSLLSRFYFLLIVTFFRRLEDDDLQSGLCKSYLRTRIWLCYKSVRPVGE